MLVFKHAHLNAIVGDQIPDPTFEPALLLGLFKKVRAGIGRRQRDLNRFGIELDRVIDRLLDGLARLAGQPDDEGAMDQDAELVAVGGKTPREVEPDTLFYVVQNLLVAGFVAYRKQAESVVLHDLERFVGYVGLGVARPGHAQLAELFRQCLDLRDVVGQRVVVEEEFLDLGEVVARPSDLGGDVFHRSNPVIVAADRLRPQAKCAA